MMRFQFCIMLIILLTGSINLSAQESTLTGTVLDEADHRPLPYAYVLLISTRDTTDKHLVVTNTSGHFAVPGLYRGLYQMYISYVSYKGLQKKVIITDREEELGNLFLKAEAKNLKDVEIVGKTPQAVQRGDTTDYNADAFKVTRDATTEDLIKKLPGVTIDDKGTVTAKGEQVKQVLLDGKPMFADDPSIALRNLPAEIVDKIQVFDKLSDQAELTGFDDGNTTRTMNIVTRSNRRNGQFGKLLLGYGDQDKYTATGSLNFFKGNRRLTLIGMSNNVNQQNFSMQDILGTSGFGQRMGGTMGSMGGGGRMGGGGGRGGQGGYFGGTMDSRNSGLNNFLVGQQNGISTTNSFGMNYSNQFGSKLTLTASYFFNKVNNNTVVSTNRQYLLSADSSQYYNENSVTNSVNFNHRFNIRLQYNIDSNNSILFIPSISLQANHSANTLFGENFYSDASPLSSSNIVSTIASTGYNSNNNLVYRHKFARPGRTLSLGFSFGINSQTPATTLFSGNKYYTGTTSSDTVNQVSNTKSNGTSVSSNIVYTEPLGKMSLLSFSLNTSFSNSYSNKLTNDFNPVSDDYSSMDTLLSNKYNFSYQTNLFGLAYRFRKNNLNFTLGSNYQNTNLNGSQDFPSAYEVKKQYNKLLPNAMMTFKVSQKMSLMLNYRASITAPSISQLQNVINNTNPLMLTTGNPDLKPQYVQTLFMRLSLTNPDKSTNFFAFLSASNTQDYISNSTIIATQDTLLQQGVILHTGSQLTSPVNIGQSWNTRAFLVFGFPVTPIKCNINLNTGVTYSESPGYLNGSLNTANNYSLTQGVVVSSNISEYVDFTAIYNLNYNIIKNSVRPDLNDNYLIHSYGLKSTFIIFKGLVFQTDLNGQSYRGLTDAYNLDVLLWNAGIGEKFLKSKNAEIRLNVYNILNKNNSIARNITSSYVEDQKSNTLGRYFLLTFTYNLRKFNSGGSFGPRG